MALFAPKDDKNAPNLLEAGSRRLFIAVLILLLDFGDWVMYSINSMGEI